MTDRAEYYFYWNPTENARGLLYIEPNVPNPHGGLLWDDAKGKLFEWKRGGKQGFVRVSDFVAEGNRIEVRIYGHSFATTTPSLANATLSALWSVYTADKWLLWELSTPAENYYFQHMRPHTFFENAYTPEDIELKGADFNLEIKYNDSGGIGLEWGTPGNTRIC